MNWFKSKINKRLQFVEERLACIDNPAKFKTGDKVWYQRWDGNNNYSYHKVIVVKHRSEWFRGHACLSRNNYYLILHDDLAFDVPEDYLHKVKPK